MIADADAVAPGPFFTEIHCRTAAFLIHRGRRHLYLPQAAVCWHNASTWSRRKAYFLEPLPTTLEITSRTIQYQTIILKNPLFAIDNRFSKTNDFIIRNKKYKNYYDYVKA